MTRAFSVPPDMLPTVENEFAIDGWRVTGVPYDDVGFIGGGDVVLDLGANVGAFACWCLDRGARVIAVEPSPAAARVCRANVFQWPLAAAVIEAAAVEPRLHGRRVPLYEGSVHVTHSTDYKAGRAVIAEPLGLSLRYLLSVAPATVIKVDIEGAEYGVFADDGVDLSAVGAIVAELHLQRAPRAALYRLVDWLRARGFEPTREVVIARGAAGAVTFVRVRGVGQEAA